MERYEIEHKEYLAKRDAFIQENPLIMEIKMRKTGAQTGKKVRVMTKKMEKGLRVEENDEVEEEQGSESSSSVSSSDEENGEEEDFIFDDRTKRV